MPILTAKTPAIMVIVAILVSGCAGPAAPPQEVEQIGYRSSNGEELWFRFSNEIGNVAFFDESKQTLILHVSRHADFRTWGTYWVDRDMLLVAEGGACLQVIQDRCVRTQITFSPTGRIGPMLIGLPRAHDYVTETNVSPPSEAAQPWRLDPFVPEFGGGGTFGILARFDNEFFPSEVEWRSETGKTTTWQRVTGYSIPSVNGADRIAVDAIPRATLPDQGAIFPGEHSTIRGLNVSHVAPFEALLNASETAAAMADGGCVIGVREQVRTDDEPSNAIASTVKAFFFFRLVKDGSGTKEWLVALEEDLLGRDRFVVERESEVNSDLTCSQRNALRYAIDADYALETYDRLDLQEVQGTPEFRMKFLKADRYKLRFEIAATPPHVDTTAASGGFQPYIVRVDATSGWIDRVILHPTDAARLGWMPDR